MGISPSTDNNPRAITLAGILPDVRQLPSSDKLRLIRILAEELEGDESSHALKPDKTYNLPTPYDTFGVGEVLMDALGTPAQEE